MLMATNVGLFSKKKHKPSGSKAGTLGVHGVLGNQEASVQVWRYLAVKTLETSCD